MEITLKSVLEFVVSKPFISALAYFAFNLLVYGFRGIFGGFLLVKIEIGDKSFVTSRRNAFHSEKLTRIAQWRCSDGENLPNKLRQELLEKYGPAAGKHYKDVVRTCNTKTE